MERERVIGRLSQIPRGEGRNFDVGGTGVAVFHTHAGEVFATQPNCPHRQGPLADGLLGGAAVICPLHDRVFDLRTGQELGAGCRLRVYDVRATADGEIVLSLEPVGASEMAAAD